MNDIFQDLIGMGVAIYLDDILIYSESEQEHIVLVKRVLASLRERRLAIAPVPFADVATQRGMPPRS